MRQRWIIVVGVWLLLAGCSREAGNTGAGNPDVPKQPFVQRLIEACAGVNRQLADVQPSAEPGRVADQLNGFVRQARAQTPPRDDRQHLDALLNSLSDSASKYQAAQTAMSSGNKIAASTAVQEGNRSMQAADRAARQYGMPHLADCDKSLRTPPTSVQPALAWRAGQGAPVAAQQLSGAVVGGVIWVVGGLTSTGATRKVQGYDPPINQWKMGPDLPVPLHHVMAAAYNDQLVVMGGWMPQGSDLQAVASDRVFVLRDGTWTQLPRLNRPRAAGAAAVVGDKIVVVGGRVNDGLVKTTEVFDGTRWHDRADIPTPRDHLAAVSDGTHLYAVGGRMLTSSKNTAALERYDPNTNQWTKLPPMPTARGGLGAAIVGGRLIAVGGEAPTSVFRTVEAFDIASGTWSRLPNLQQGRHGLAVTALGDSLYAIGGAAQPSHTATSSAVEILGVPGRPTKPAKPAPPVSSTPSAVGPRIKILTTRPACTGVARTPAGSKQEGAPTSPMSCLQHITVRSAGTGTLQLTSFEVPREGVRLGAPPALPPGQVACTEGLRLRPGQSCLLEVVFGRPSSITIHQNIPPPNTGTSIRLTAPDLRDGR